MEKKQPLQQKLLGKLSSSLQKTETRSMYITLYTTLWSMSSQAIWELASGSSTGALLVSSFNVKWRCYAHAGGVEESKFCLFSVVFPCKVYLQCLFKILL
jgi:hypothetical protein